MKYPKVLIIGQTFNNNTGPGITNTNLFLNWPRENIGIISGSTNENWSICGLQYVLGQKESAKPWPFSMLQEGTPSVIIRKGIRLKSSNEANYITPDGGRSGLSPRQIVRNYIKKALNYSGIFLFFSKIQLSRNLSEFIEDFHPDIIYTQLASLELIGLVKDIHVKFHIPIAIHIMDDWPVMIYKTGLLGFYWNRRTNIAFQELINNASVHLSISDAMSVEYKRRYGKKWLAFHNPVDKIFMSSDNVDNKVLINSNSILYLGRIGDANEESIFFIINTIIDLNQQDRSIEFIIYTRDFMDLRLNQFHTNKCIRIFPEIPHSEVPSILKSAGALILPLDFSKSAKKFAQYSMPTKATEYMASGVPILVFAPAENAVTNYARDNDWGYVVDQEDKYQLQKGIIELLDNKVLRNKLIANAESTVFKNHAAENVRERFRQVLSNSSNRFEN
jgi:glycosyltransferase involved in cell wall biosynthesis